MNEPTRLIPGPTWRECLPVLDADGVAGIPTDTVYGIAALPGSARAIDRIYEAKGRPPEKALPMLVSSLVAVQRIARLSPIAARLCTAFWPGALTVVVQAAPSFNSPALADDGSVAVRMPASALALGIIAAAGGVLAVTSANLSGLPPATTAGEVLEQLSGWIDVVVDGGVCAGGIASTIVRAFAGEAEILREGAISADRIQASIRSC